MASSKPLTVEHTALVLEVLSGEATTQQISELDQLLKSRPELIESVVDLVGQEAWLAWSSTNELPDGQNTRSATAAALDARPKSSFPHRAMKDSWSWKWSLAASIALVTTGVITGAIGMYSFSPGPVADNSTKLDDQGDLSERDYSARVVEMSACRWSPTKGSALLTNSVIRKGESINLLEGLAQLSIENANGRSTLDVEGPAAVVLTADAGCSIGHGRVCANVSSFGEPFTIDTPSCLVKAVGDRSNFGVAVDGRRVEIHVFDGAANVVVPWGTEQGDSLSSELHAGESLILAPDSSGRMAHTRGTSNPRSFTARTSMMSNHLVIPDDYPQAVLSLDPLLYWRFEQGDSQKVDNLASEKYTGIIHGKLTPRRDGGNGYIDFGGGVSEEELTAFVTTQEPVAIGGRESYSLELWMKPSHCHHCSLAAFFLPEESSNVKKHGFLLELGGPTAMEFSLVEPGKVRYLHRSPPGETVGAGTCCFSAVNYEVRKWQHIVAVKQPEEMKLYIDGRLAGSVADNTHLTDALQMVVGQLDDGRFMRRFVGQMDEVALYPSALSEEVVLEHYNMVKNAEAEKRGRINTDDI